MKTIRSARRWFIAAAVIPIFVLAGGCSHPNPLVGKWTNTTGQYTQVMKLGSDGSWSTRADSSITHNSAEFSGTYEASNGTLTLTQTSTILNGVRRPLTEQIRAPQEMTYQVDGNKLTITAGGKSLNYTRVQ